jgi:hypothetical protein
LLRMQGGVAVFLFGFPGCNCVIPGSSHALILIYLPLVFLCRKFDVVRPRVTTNTRK